MKHSPKSLFDFIQETNREYGLIGISSDPYFDSEEEKKLRQANHVWEKVITIIEGEEVKENEQ